MSLHHCYNISHLHTNHKPERYNSDQAQEKTQPQTQAQGTQKAPQTKAKPVKQAASKANTSKSAATLRSQKAETNKPSQNTVLEETHEDALFGSLEDALNSTDESLAENVTQPQNESENSQPDYQEPSNAELAEIYAQEEESEFLDDELFGNMEDALNNAPEYTAPTMS